MGSEEVVYTNGYVFLGLTRPRRTNMKISIYDEILANKALKVKLRLLA